MSREHEPDRTYCEVAQLTALRAGDESAFLALVDRYHATMVRLAQNYVSSRAIAEEVAQEAWLGAFRGLAKFEGRSSVRAWLFRILINHARFQAGREGRSVPFSALRDSDRLENNPEDSEWSFTDSPPCSPASVAEPQGRWDADALDSLETREQIRKAIEALPRGQREVIILRDLQEWTSEEVCEALGVSSVNQRVLLHRARSNLRTAIARHFTGTDRRRLGPASSRQPEVSLLKEAA